MGRNGERFSCIVDLGDRIVGRSASGMMDVERLDLMLADGVCDVLVGERARVFIRAFGGGRINVEASFASYKALLI